MRSASRIIVLTFGTLTGLMGIEHGIGEIFQGNVAPEGFMIQSWPESAFFQILAGEPALTIVPNLLVTGILAVLVSIIFILWATVFIEKKNSGFVLILTSILLLLVGGGIFPPILGVLIGIVAIRIHAPITGLRTSHSTAFVRLYEKLWTWSFFACLVAWLLMFPGVPVLHYFFGVSSEGLIYGLLFCMFVFLVASAFSGAIYDTQKMKVHANEYIAERKG